MPVISSAWEAEAGRLSWNRGKLGLYSEYQTSQSFIERSYLKKTELWSRVGVQFKNWNWTFPGSAAERLPELHCQRSCRCVFFHMGWWGDRLTCSNSGCSSLLACLLMVLDSSSGVRIGRTAMCCLVAGNGEACSLTIVPSTSCASWTCEEVWAQRWLPLGSDAQPWP